MTGIARKTTVKPNRNNKKTLKTILPVVEAVNKPRTKSATVIALLEGRSGATVTEIATATGWQNHSIRGFLSGTVKKKLGHNVGSEMVDGERRYRIVG
jgi:hypothetical protein